LDLAGRNLGLRGRDYLQFAYAHGVLSIGWIGFLRNRTASKMTIR
jgi:hypothetical protein